MRAIHKRIGGDVRVGGACEPTGSTRGMGVWGKGLSGFAGSEPPAFVAGLDDVAMVGQLVEERGGHLGIAEHLWPFAEREIDGDDKLLFCKS